MARYKERKNLQRKLNAYIRAMNANVAHDELWRGRFVAHQEQANYFPFNDGSGGEMSVKFVFHDKKTKQNVVKYIHTFTGTRFLGGDIWHAMNDFIVEDINVWQNDKPREDTTDYRKVKAPWED